MEYNTHSSLFYDKFPSERLSQMVVCRPVRYTIYTRETRHQLHSCGLSYSILQGQYNWVYHTEFSFVLHQFQLWLQVQSLQFLLENHHLKTDFQASSLDE